jgi:hypothetical protein
MKGSGQCTHVPVHASNTLRVQGQQSLRNNQREVLVIPYITRTLFFLSVRACSVVSRLLSFEVYPQLQADTLFLS